jgi:YbbR domain-containing protein
LRNALDQNRWLSSSVQINEFSPDEIKYKIEELDEKKIPVEPNVKFNFSEGYGLVAETSVEPESVLVRGPYSIINELKSIPTVEKIYSSVDKSIVENINLAMINNLEYEPEQVKISFDVQKIVDKEFQNIPIEIKNIPPSKNLTVYPEKISVILRGGINLLGKLNPDEIKVTISFNQAIRDTLGYLVPNVVVPEFTELVDTKPNKLEYIIQQL